MASTNSQLKLSLHAGSEVPIYVQVKNQLRLLIDQGRLEEGARLPPVRELAAELDINVNTAQRIYHELEREGYLDRRRGIGTFAIDPHKDGTGDVPGKSALVETVRQLRQLGYTKQQVIDLTQEVLKMD